MAVALMLCALRFVGEFIGTVRISNKVKFIREYINDGVASRKGPLKKDREKYAPKHGYEKFLKSKTSNRVSSMILSMFIDYLL